MDIQRDREKRRRGHARGGGAEWGGLSERETRGVEVRVVMSDE